MPPPTFKEIVKGNWDIWKSGAFPTIVRYNSATPRDCSTFGNVSIDAAKRKGTITEMTSSWRIGGYYSIKYGRKRPLYGLKIGNNQF